MTSNQKVPASGWVFDMGKVSLIAANKQQLIEILRQYRKSNRIPEGDLEKDIEEHIEAKNEGYKFSNFKMEIAK